MSLVPHGGLRDEEARAAGVDPAAVIDLSTNLHPAGPHPAVVRAAAEAPIGRHPDPQATPLRAAIAALHGVDPTMVLVTAGATEAIYLVARTLLRPGDRATLFDPTFGEYAAAIRAAGATVVSQRAAPPAFAVDLPAVTSAPLAYLCQPNNPTGVYHAHPTVVDLLGRLAGGTLALDLTYEPFVEEAWDVHALVRAGAPVIAIHSLTKLHAIPGLRLGYAVAAPATVARLAAAIPPWTVDAPALAAGIVAVGQDEERRGALAAMWRTRERLRTAWEQQGLAVAPGRANFLLVRVGAADRLRAALLRRGFAVRDCASFGLPRWVRIAVPAAGEADRLLDAFERAAREVAG